MARRWLQTMLEFGGGSRIAMVIGWIREVGRKFLFGEWVPALRSWLFMFRNYSLCFQSLDALVFESCLQWSFV
jgi:hypothetical protein